MNQYIERYFQAKSEGIPSQMGAAGTSIAVKALEDMGYKIIWADTITGTKKGPDISLFDNHGNKITAEVKSTSIIADYNHRLNEAINDIETRAHFVAEIDVRGLGDDELLRRTYKHVDAMTEAWELYRTWLYGKERLKIVRSKAHL